MVNDSETNSSDLDDLFGGPDASEQYVKPAMVTQPPMSLPAPITLPEWAPSQAVLPLPVPLPPAEFADDKTGLSIQLQETNQLDSCVSGGTGDQWQTIMTSMQGPSNGQKQTDLSVLFQQFLAQQAAGTAPVASLYNISQVALPTQLQSKTNPPPAGAKLSHARNKNEGHRIWQYDWYDTFPVQPNWVANDSSKQIPIKYTKHGELKLPTSLDRHGIEAYVRGCAQQGILLRLWIQNVPTMHTDRYPSSRYHRCRAPDCPDKGTLGRGAYQVCFDEHPAETSNGRYDPFYVAGYIHLFCLEEMMSLAHLLTFADVQPDVRDLPLEERNPMSLHRDGMRVLEDAYYEWKKTHHDSLVKAGLRISKSPSKSDSDCLYYRLTKKKLETQPKTRQKMRDQRKGNDISKYFGNLRKRAERITAARKKRKMARFSSDNSSIVDLSDVIASAPAPDPKRQRAGSACTRTRPALQTAALSVIQPQPSKYSASRLRQSRRLSGAHGTSQITIPATSAYTPYGNIGITSCAGAMSTALDDRQSLNVRTDNMALAYNVNFTPNIDGLVYDFRNACDQYMDQDFGNANGYTDVHYLHFGQVNTPGGNYCVTTTPVPYDLRSTPARRETAIRQTSARISQTEGIRCDEKSLIEAVRSPSIIVKTPAVNCRASRTTARSASQQQVGQVGTPLSAARRVTRSMGRNVSTAEMPSGQNYNLDWDLLFPQGLDDFQNELLNFESFA